MIKIIKGKGSEFEKLNITIGIVGRIGDGKDTLANIINSYFWMEYGCCIFKVAFGDNVKHICSSLTGIEIDYFYDRDYKDNKYWSSRLHCFVNLEDADETKIVSSIEHECPNCMAKQILDIVNNGDNYIKLRTIMQIIGTDIFQNLFGKNIWTTSVINNRVSKIISDVRFVHEYEAIMNDNENNIVIRVVNTKNPADKSNHLSERVDDIPVNYNNIIVWDGVDINELKNKAIKLLKKYISYETV